LVIDIPPHISLRLERVSTVRLRRERGLQGKANFRGHPLHLMLISFPVAFWTGALFTDAVGAWRHDDFWFRMSVVLIAMGTAGAVFASVCGYIDYRTVRMSRKARSVATGHMLWSLGATAVFALALALRVKAWHAPWGIAVTIAGGAVLLVGGYLGSELSNRFRIGILDAPPSSITGAQP
jgi:uncharacterized membrane protein